MKAQTRKPVHGDTPKTSERSARQPAGSNSLQGGAGNQAMQNRYRAESRRPGWSGGFGMDTELSGKHVPTGEPFSSPLSRPPVTNRIQRQCAQCEADQEQDPESHGVAAAARTNLTVGASDDPYEREADDVAARIMAKSADGTTSTMQRRLDATDGIQRKCVACEAAEEEEQESLVQGKREDASASSPAGDKVRNAVGNTAAGTPLAEGIRAQVEPELNSDLSDVRVHTGGDAADAASEIDAKAFTHKNHIYLAANQRSDDVELMAHESAHVVQQTGRRQPPELQRRQEQAQNDRARDRQAAPDIQRNDEDHSDETYAEFGERVKTAAIARLQHNIEVLGEWHSYVMDMSGFELQTQLMTSLVSEYAKTASQTPAGRARFETFAGTENPHERAFRGSQLAPDAEYRETVGNFMAFLASKTKGYTTSPSVAQRLQVRAGDREASDLAEPRSVGPDPRYSAYAGPIQRFQTGESGGCQTCHDINRAWQQTADIYGDPLPSGPAFRGFEPLVELDEGGERTDVFGLNERDHAAVQAFIDDLESSSPPTGDSGATSAPSRETPTSEPPGSETEANPFLPDAPVPEGVELPPLRSDLCGEPSPAGDERDARSNFDPSTWGPNSAIVADIIGRIGAVLTPLGPRGYQVIERRSFDELWAAGPDGMGAAQSQIAGDIETKQREYRQLQERIRGGEVPFTDLCPIVDELLPSTNARVRHRVLREIAEQRFIEFLVQAADFALLALAFIYPPSIVATLPLRVGLGLAKVAVGTNQIRRGRDINLGQGAGVFSREQEARAEGDISAGWMNILAGGIDLAGIGASRLLRRPPTPMEQELIANGWRRQGGIVWTRPGQSKTIWQSGNTFEFMDESGRYVGRVHELGDGRQLIEPLTGGGGGGLATGRGTSSTALAPSQSGPMVPWMDAPPGLPRGAGGLEPFAPGRLPGPVPGGSLGYFSTPQEPFGYLPASGSSGLPEGDWVLADLTTAGSLSDVPASSLPYAGNRAWGRSADNWWLYRPAEAERIPSTLHQYRGAGGDRGLVLDIPGQTRSLHTDPLVEGSSHGRGYPMTTPEMTDPQTGARLARSHLDPHARSRPMVTVEGPGTASTRDPLNYVGHDRRYNEWVRRTLEGRLSDSQWQAIQIWQTPRTTTGGYPIVTEEIIIELGPNGQAARAWRFPTTEGFWDDYSNIDRVLGPRSEGGFQIPVDEIPTTLTGSAQ